MWATAEAAVDRGELQHAVVQRFFFGLARNKIEPPPVGLGAHAPRVEETEQLPVVVVVVRPAFRNRAGLMEAVQHDLVAVLVGIDPMEDIGGIGLEPSDADWLAAPRHDGEAARYIRIEAHCVHAALEELWIPEHRQVIEDGIVLSEGHVVWEPRSRQLYGHIANEL